MAVKITQPARNLREELNELRTPTGVAGEAMLRADTPQEQFNLIGAGRKNLIINGGFDVWQRGTSQTSQGYGSADRWFFNLATCGGTITKAEDALYGNYVHYTGQAISGAIFYHGVELYNGTGKPSGFIVGETYTFSFMYRSTESCKIQFAWRTNVGAGTSQLVKEVTGLGSGSGEWEKITCQFVCTTPLGTANVLQINIFDEGELVDRDITNVQLELGKVATPFEHRSYGEELALCQRYYWKGGLANSGVSYRYAESSLDRYDIGDVSFPVAMRASPTLTIVTSPVYANCSHFDLAMYNAFDGFSHQVTTTAAGVFRGYGGVYSADAEL